MATLAPPAPTEAASTADITAPAAKKGGRKRLFVALPMVLAAAAGAWLFLKPGPPANATEKVEPGPVVQLEAITLNLSDGHYLKLGLGLQLTEKAAEEAAAAHGEAATEPLVDAAPALDAAISVLGDRTYAQLLAKGGRAKAKAAMDLEIKHRYEGKVMAVYLTQFVMQ
jgi:flagellar FliL protein